MDYGRKKDKSKATKMYQKKRKKTIRKHLHVNRMFLHELNKIFLKLVVLSQQSLSAFRQYGFSSASPTALHDNQGIRQPAVEFVKGIPGIRIGHLQRFNRFVQGTRLFDQTEQLHDPWIDFFTIFRFDGQGSFDDEIHT
jgi:hypothetical protein